MRRKLSAAVDRVRRLFGSTASGPDDATLSREDEADDGPDLYECSGCGSVFISRPNQCSECGDDDFSNVGKFN
ncbi:MULTISPECIES: hypothetical protein [Halorussus]|uniref:hypothetical protein n=1 Tax=Halorussus TaxID=1070314 RepID=UPI0020A0CB0C|nr:hypothetical protein [Halorussus vallis]USZ76592.1 hypothetical protein NGM07_04505 [Halorussus vallis]